MCSVWHDGVVRLQQSCAVHHNLRPVTLELLDHGGVVLVGPGGLVGLQADQALCLLCPVHLLGEVDELGVTVSKEIIINHFKTANINLLFIYKFIHE